MHIALAYSQKESNIWYFGAHAGVDFSSGSPTALTDGQINTQEGCSVISDQNGQLLFYTDGVNVWNRHHQIMPNGTGLLGHDSSTQSSIIIPKPNSLNIYYIFTTDAYENKFKNGVRYSEVNMDLDAGSGDVTSNKNILLHTPSSEKLTAARNADGSGYWVLTHGNHTDKFLAYLVTDLGVDPTPVISTAGPATESLNSYLKFSPDATKVVDSNGYYETALFDFDASTGVVSNYFPFDIYAAYGAEFSPSGNILYIATNTQIVQYDLNAADILSSQLLLYEYDFQPESFLPEALQLANNGKIYFAQYQKNALGAINNPDIAGPGCNFQPNAVSLGTGTCLFGLPQFIQSYFNVSFTTKKLCLGDLTEFSLNNNQPVSSVIWNFGDGSTSSEINPKHIYSNAGTYHVSVTAVGASGAITKEKDILISAPPTVLQPEDLAICDDNNDGLKTYDLTAQNVFILNGLNPEKYSINYFINGIKITSPEKYSNKSPYAKELITAEVSHKTNTNCKTVVQFHAQVFDSPMPAPSSQIPNLVSCDNKSVGTDNDGKIIFDLTQKQAAILKGQSSAQFSISYYKDQALTKEITLPATYNNMEAIETVFAKVSNRENPKCSQTTSFKIEVLSLPSINQNTYLKQCDDNVDGLSFFNLEEAISKITANSSVEKITFHETLLDAQNGVNPILTPTAYLNKKASSDAVYARVENTSHCSSVSKLNLIVTTTQIPSTYSRLFSKCDDSSVGTSNDGISTFDFSIVTEEIKNDIFPAGQLLEIRYYENIQDALAEKNAIADISNYKNANSPYLQKIFIRVDSSLNNDCLGLGQYLTLQVNPIPTPNSLEKIHCDDDNDGVYAFDTTNFEQELLNGLTNGTVSYRDQNNNPLPSPLPNPFLTRSQLVSVTVSNSSSCSSNATIRFVVDAAPKIFPLDPTLTTVCDDEADPALQDGKYAFDTSSFESKLIGPQTGMIIRYYDSGNKLMEKLPNPYITSSQNIKVEVINPKNTACSATATIPFVVNPLPSVRLHDDELICSNLPNFTKQIDGGLLDPASRNDYNYQWFLDGAALAGETNYTFQASKAGTYTVEVSSNKTQCSRTRTIKIAASDIPSDIMTYIDDANTVSVAVSGNGNYVYALDDENENFQTDAKFYNVRAGIHSVYIKDLNGCGTVSKEIAVFGIPSFFTPNQDGYNDYWNIQGVDQDSKASAMIQIFDRYGKLIKQISPSSQGWDGTYLGSQMPSDDYWYVIKLKDDRIFKGHFTLKR